MSQRPSRGQTNIISRFPGALWRSYEAIPTLHRRHFTRIHGFAYAHTGSIHLSRDFMGEFGLSRPTRADIPPGRPSAVQLRPRAEAVARKFYKFSCAIGKPGLTSAGIFDSSGRLVRVLWTMKEATEAGPFEGKWNGKDGNGKFAPPGEYTWKMVVNRSKYENIGTIGNSASRYMMAMLNSLSMLLPKIANLWTCRSYRWLSLVTSSTRQKVLATDGTRIRRQCVYTSLRLRPSLARKKNRVSEENGKAG